MKYLLSLSILFITSSAFTQLSEKWEGKFTGTLFSTNLEDKVVDYQMELHIKMKSDYTYDWTIVYGSDSTRQEREYILKPDGKNHFMLDEQNGIALHMSHSDNSITSVFEVDGNLLHVKYNLSKKGIMYELTSSNGKAATGGGKIDGQKVQTVYTYKTIAFQSAFLKRQKK